MIDRNEIYQKSIRISTIIALLMIIAIFQLFPKIDWEEEEGPAVVISSIQVENIPVTKQGRRKPPPPKPAIPIPSEDELIPEDITIEETELDLNIYSKIQGTGPIPGAPVIFQPRPIYEVIPEYPPELQKKGVQGIVKLHIHINKFGRVDKVIILENTSGSPLCARAAKEAAFQGRYVPAKSKGKPTEIWITRTYTFGLTR